MPLAFAFRTYAAPGDSVYFFKPDNSSSSSSYFQPEAGAVCRLQGYAGPIVQLAYGEMVDAGDGSGDSGGRPARRLAWRAALVNTTSSTSSSESDDVEAAAAAAVRFEVRALAAPAPFEDVTLALSLPPAVFAPTGAAGGAGEPPEPPRFVVVENGAVPVERPSGWGPKDKGTGGAAAASVGEAFFPSVSRASLLSSSSLSSSAAPPALDRQRLRGPQGRRRGEPQPQQPQQPQTEGGEPSSTLAALHLVGHAPHAVASLVPGQLEVALHRRAPVR